MTTPSRTVVCRIEPLESRIAPAGNIVATLAGGVLTLTGDDADNVLVVRIGVADVLLTPDASTSINSGPLGDDVLLQELATSMRANFKNGDDNISIDPAADFVLPNGAVFAMGDSDNTLTLNTSGKLNLGSLTVSGGDGLDTFTLEPTGSVKQVSGATSLSFRDGGSTTKISSMQLTALSVSGGEGNDVITLGQSIVTGGVTAALGNGLANDLDIANTQLGSLTATGYGANSLSISTTAVTGGVRYTFVAAVSATFTSIGVDGAMSVLSTKKESNANTTWIGTSTLGSLSIKGGDDAAFTLQTGSKLTVAGDVTLTARHDDATLDINEAELSARNLTMTSLGDEVDFNVNDTAVAPSTSKLTLTGALTLAALDRADYDQADGIATVANGVKLKGTRIVSLTVREDASLSTPADVSVISSGGSATVNLNGAILNARNLTVTGTSATYSQVAAAGAAASDLNLAGLMTLKGTVNIASFTQQNGTADVLGSVTLSGKDDADFTQSGASVTTTFGKLTMTAAQNESDLDVTGQSFSVKGDVNVTGFTHSDVTMLPTAVSDLEGNVLVKGGAEVDDFAIGANVRFLKNLSIAQGGGNNKVNLTGANGTTVEGNLTITTGSGNDTVTLLRAGVSAALKITTGAGADTLAIDSGVYRGTSLVDTGAGDDFINIAQLTAVASPVSFNGLATILAGAGNDRLQLGLAVGNGGNGDSRAQFIVEFANKIDGGSGLNSFDDEAGQFSGILLGTGIVGWTDAT